MINELDQVILEVDIPEHGLERGDLGTVVLVHGNEGDEVEFMTLDGETVALVSLARTKVQAIGRGEIAHARIVSH
jgi:hypothetical protein